MLPCLIFGGSKNYLFVLQDLIKAANFKGKLVSKSHSNIILLFVQYYFHINLQNIFEIKIVEKEHY